jgi:hypothetical protein
MLTQQYNSLVVSRRHIALFAHHDGATGTSRRLTMDDYGRKLLESFKSCMNVQRQSIAQILRNSPITNLTSIRNLALDYQLENFGDTPTKIARMIYESDTIVKKIAFYNSLAWNRVHLAKILVTSPDVSVISSSGLPISSQVNPVPTFDEYGMKFREKVFELCFLAELDPLSVSIFEIRRASPADSNLARRPLVSCTGCHLEDRVFEVEPLQQKVKNILKINHLTVKKLSSPRGRFTRAPSLHWETGMWNYSSPMSQDYFNE